MTDNATVAQKADASKDIKESKESQESKESSADRLLHESLLLSADSRANLAAVKQAPADLQSVNVDRQISSDGSVITRYPNGVTFQRLGGKDYSMEAPPGGKVDVDPSGAMSAYDAHHKLLGKLDKDGTMHVYGKNGEYTESQDGRVDFRPAPGQPRNQESLHHSGSVAPGKYEDYGISAHGNVTRFPNGIEYDKSTNKVIVPSEYPNFQQKDETDADGKVVRQVGTDGNGKVLYYRDASGMHVPTSDGLLTENSHGGMKFQGNSTDRNGLPRVEIHDKKSTDPMDVFKQCENNPDPICGLDLGKF